MIVTHALKKENSGIIPLFLKDMEPASPVIETIIDMTRSVECTIKPTNTKFA